MHVQCRVSGLFCKHLFVHNCSGYRNVHQEQKCLPLKWNMRHVFGIWLIISLKLFLWLWEIQHRGKNVDYVGPLQWSIIHPKNKGSEESGISHALITTRSPSLSVVDLCRWAQLLMGSICALCRSAGLPLPSIPVSLLASALTVWKSDAPDERRNCSTAEVAKQWPMGQIQPSVCFCK